MSKIISADEVCSYSVGAVNEETKKNNIYTHLFNYVNDNITKVASKNSMQKCKKDLIYSICFTIQKEYQSIIVEELVKAGYDVRCTENTVGITLNLKNYLV